MTKDDIQKKLAKELKLRDYYRIRNHVGALALSDDIYTSLIARGIYIALKRRPGVFAETR